MSTPLPWQGELWSHLVEQLERGCLPHALLLAGARHTGKRRLAIALARLLLCRQPVDGVNCGNCHACDLSASGSHGDLCWLEPEDKSRVIKIDQVRAAVNFANRTAGFGRRKVVVLCPADSMNSHAANALLKCLEEPAPDTYLVLVCHRLQGVPPTIRSRCQIARHPLPDVEKSLAWLDLVTADRSRSEQLLALADQRPLLAEALYSGDGAGQRAALRSGLQGLAGDEGGAPRVAALLADLDTGELLSTLADEIRNILRSFDRNTLRTDRGRAAFGLLDEIAAIQKAVAGGANPNRQLLAEALSSRIGRELGTYKPDGKMPRNGGDINR